MAKEAQVCRHVVLFKFKDATPESTVLAIETAFRDLCRELTFIVDFEWGRNNSPENLNNGLTHCFLVTFANEQDRDRYLPHPAHVAFVKNYLEDNLESVCVVDYMPRG